MTQPEPPAPPPSAADLRAQRLAEQLRANLRRRKAQARGAAAVDGTKAEPEPD